jgi:uncharacterized membrane protein
MAEREKDTVPEHVSDNIDAIVALRAKSDRRLRRSQRAIESLTVLIGQPRTLYVLLAGVLVWTAYNYSLAAAGGRAFDPPPFMWLQGVITLYAAFMSTMIITTQIRQSKEVERNEHLQLQVNLLAEQRTAKIIALLEELRRDLPNVKNRIDPVADALQEAVPPTAVSTAIDHTMNPNDRDGVESNREPLPSIGN